MRPEAQEQYVSPRGKFAEIGEADPHMPLIEREPVAPVRQQDRSFQPMV
jgi:hypothetical protein